MDQIDDNADPKDAVRILKANLEQPHKFAQIFCEAAKSQKPIEDAIKKVIRKLLKEDKETTESVKKIQRDVNKEDWKLIIGKIGFGSWTIMVIILTIVLQSLSKKILG